MALVFFVHDNSSYKDVSSAFKSPTQLSPHFLSNSHSDLFYSNFTGVLLIPRTHQANSCLRTFALSIFLPVTLFLQTPPCSFASFKSLSVICLGRHSLTTIFNIVTSISIPTPITLLHCLLWDVSLPNMVHFTCTLYIYPNF